MMSLKSSQPVSERRQEDRSAFLNKTAYSTEEVPMTDIQTVLGPTDSGLSLMIVPDAQRDALASGIVEGRPSFLRLMGDGTHWPQQLIIPFAGMIARYSASAQLPLTDILASVCRHARTQCRLLALKLDEREHD